MDRSTGMSTNISEHQLFSLNLNVVAERIQGASNQQAAQQGEFGFWFWSTSHAKTQQTFFLLLMDLLWFCIEMQTHPIYVRTRNIIAVYFSRRCSVRRSFTSRSSVFFRQQSISCLSLAQNATTTYFNLQHVYTCNSTYVRDVLTGKGKAYFKRRSVHHTL